MADARPKAAALPRTIGAAGPEATAMIVIPPAMARALPEINKTDIIFKHMEKLYDIL